ncbi:MAG: hypothetical protein K0M45_03800 [Candidatus Paracaedibacteraceae bacterium]|nr:hypothetical protein [Candidatus Paracaedibacteraceae bacterium]
MNRYPGAKGRETIEEIKIKILYKGLLQLCFLWGFVGLSSALEEEGEAHPSANLYPHTQKIALNYTDSFRIQSDELEGGYMLVFDHTGSLKNPKVCSLYAIQKGIRYASYEAHGVMGILIEELHKKITYAAFQHFLAAASGDDGVNNKGNGGTSPAIAFYNIRRLNKIFSQNEEIKKSIPEALLKDFYEIHKKCSKPAYGEENLSKSLTSIRTAITAQSRSLKSSKSHS